MKRTLLTNSLVILMLGTGFGCGWKEMEGWSGYAVWSDDDTAVVAVYEYFEGKSSVTHVKKRNIESEIFLMPYGAFDEEPQQLAAKSPGRVTELFFMRNAGYLIVNREDRQEELDDGMNQTSDFYVDKVSLDGTVTPLGSKRALTMISCDAEGQSSTTTGDVLTAYPSPEGNLIARVETDTTCQRQNATITFLTADTLETIGAPFTTTHTNAQLPLVEYAWLESGRFAQVKMSFQGPVGHSYAPNSDPESINGMSYDCFFPATTSSETNALGENVSANNGEITIQTYDHGGATFGCPN